MSSMKRLPTSLARRRTISAPPERSHCSDRRRVGPAASGRANHLSTGLSTASAMRAGASRKSRALAVGGVSSTTRSNCPPVAKPWSASIAAYSCEPVSVVVIWR